MAKNVFYLLTLGTLVLFTWACTHVYTPNAPVITIPVPTPTPNLTPVCGMTPVTLSGPYSLNWLASGVTVIRDLATWNSYFTYVQGTNPSFPIIPVTPGPSPTPIPPPVDFTTQMVVLENLRETCNNLGEMVTITNVCVGPTQVTVDVTDSVCGSCPVCNNTMATQLITSIVAVPRSDLPVSVVTTTVTH